MSAIKMLGKVKKVLHMLAIGAFVPTIAFAQDFGQAVIDGTTNEIVYTTHAVAQEATAAQNQTNLAFDWNIPCGPIEPAARASSEAITSLEAVEVTNWAPMRECIPSEDWGPNLEHQKNVILWQYPLSAWITEDGTRHEVARVVVTISVGHWTFPALRTYHWNFEPANLPKRYYKPGTPEFLFSFPNEKVEQLARLLAAQTGAFNLRYGVEFYKDTKRYPDALYLVEAPANYGGYTVTEPTPECGLYRRSHVFLNETEKEASFAEDGAHYSAILNHELAHLRFGATGSDDLKSEVDVPLDHKPEEAVADATEIEYFRAVKIPRSGERGLFSMALWANFTPESIEDAHQKAYDVRRQFWWRSFNEAPFKLGYPLAPALLDLFEFKGAKIGPLMKLSGTTCLTGEDVTLGKLLEKTGQPVFSFNDVALNQMAACLYKETRGTHRYTGTDLGDMLPYCHDMAPLLVDRPVVNVVFKEPGYQCYWLSGGNLSTREYFLTTPGNLRSVFTMLPARIDVVTGVQVITPVNFTSVTESTNSINELFAKTWDLNSGTGFCIGMTQVQYPGLDATFRITSVAKQLPPMTNTVYLPMIRR